MTETTKPQLYAAIAKAMGEVKHVTKDSRNKEQNYNFASVDDFLGMTGPICAANGLSVMMDEDEVLDFERQGKYNIVHWLRIRFSITVYHASGETTAPVKRTVEVIRTGAQSFGSAQSYALKQFLRALFQISTGDADDADFAEKGEGTPTPMAKQEPQKQADAPKDPRKIADSLISNMAKASDYETWNKRVNNAQFKDALDWLSDNAAPMAGEVRKAIGDAKLRVTPKDEPTGDTADQEEIPYDN